jgi:hypothetical protein
MHAPVLMDLSCQHSYNYIGCCWWGRLTECLAAGSNGEVFLVLSAMHGLGTYMGITMMTDFNYTDLAGARPYLLRSTRVVWDQCKVLSHHQFL